MSKSLLELINKDLVILFIEDNGDLSIVINDNELTEEQAEVLETIVTTLNEPSFVLVFVIYLEKLFNRFSDWIADYLS